MRHAILMLLALIVVAGEAAAQLKDGDLVFTVTLTSPTTVSYVAYLDPVNPSTVTVFSTAPAGTTITGIRMKPKTSALTWPGNYNMVIGWNKASGASQLAEVDRAGTQSGGWGKQLPGAIGGFDYDCNDTWVVSTWAFLPGNWTLRALYGVQMWPISMPAVYSSRISMSSVVDQFGDIAIARDSGSTPYVVGYNWSTMYNSKGKLLAADQKNTLTTLTEIGWVNCIESHPRSGEYLTSYTQWNGGPRHDHLALVSQSGKVTSLGYGFRANAARITRDDHAWLIGGDYSSYRIVKFDLARKAAVATIPLQAPRETTFTGIEVYGRHPLTCGLAGNPSFEIDVNSRHPLAAGASYILAASPARRPGMKFTNGEWLDLDSTHPLFWLTALNLAPQTFVNFQGVLDQNGNNTKPITVNIPPGLPRMNGSPIFVAGVIYMGSNIIQVTNTHWFVL